MTEIDYGNPESAEKQVLKHPVLWLVASDKAGAAAAGLIFACGGGWCWHAGTSSHQNTHGDDGGHRNDPLPPHFNFS